MVAVAVKVTAEPLQILVVLAATVTAGVSTGSTVVVIAFEVAVAGLLHAAFEVTTTRTISVLFKLFVIKVGESIPAFVPFTFH